MKKLVFATHNINKVKEIQNLTKNKIRILSLKDIGHNDPINEDQSTIEGNASKKAWLIYNHYKMNCFADDTGLEVEALKGKPGVFSARFAELTDEVLPNEKVPEANIRKLLRLLNDRSNRKARFRTIISLVINGQEKLFEGIVNGIISKEKSGTEGFGYDPVFIPEGFDLTFAEMSLNEKNKISHRAKAVNELIKYLDRHY